MCIPSGKDEIIAIYTDVSDANIRLLLVQRELSKEGLLINYLEDKLEHRIPSSHVEVTYKNVFYSLESLRRLF